MKTYVRKYKRPLVFAGAGLIALLVSFVSEVSGCDDGYVPYYFDLALDIIGTIVLALSLPGLSRRPNTPLSQAIGISIAGLIGLAAYLIAYGLGFSHCYTF